MRSRRGRDLAGFRRTKYRRHMTKGQKAMASAQRCIEARIGQLLGPAKRGRPEKVTHDEPFHRAERYDFRLLARALKDPDVFRIGKEVHDLKPPQV